MTAIHPVAVARARNSHIFERQAEDWYVEPVWVWTRLFKHLGVSGQRLHDPACGRGTCVEAACIAGLIGSGSDIVARWVGQAEIAGSYDLADFQDGIAPVDVIASNPPFKLARAFAEAAMVAAPVACLLLPATWACGDAKARWLAGTPLSEILFLTPRPSMLPGAGAAPDTKLGGGTKDYAIFVWTRGHVGQPRVGWLHRDGDRQADWCAERAR